MHQSLSILAGAMWKLALYCYAYTGRDLLEDQVQQLYRRTDIVQMSRYFTIEVAQSTNHLSPRHARFPL